LPVAVIYLIDITSIHVTNQISNEVSYHSEGMPEDSSCKFSS
jgi:hypothetical protein